MHEKRETRACVVFPMDIRKLEKSLPCFLRPCFYCSWKPQVHFPSSEHKSLSFSMFEDLLMFWSIYSSYILHIIHQLLSVCQPPNMANLIIKNILKLQLLVRFSLHYVY